GGAAATQPQFTVPAKDVIVDGAATADYARLILAADREQFYAAYRSDVRPTTDDRPFFFHTTKLSNQFDVAFGRSMLFGNGLSALLTLLGISTGLVVLFVIGPLALGVATPIVTWAIPFSRAVRVAIAVGMLVPLGVALGIPMPTGLRMLSARAPHMVAWAWGMNGALSVLGATLAIFIAMNWGFRVTLLSASATYFIGLIALLVVTSR